MKLLNLSAILAVLLLSACTDSPDSTISSDAVLTSDIYTTFHLVDEGDDKIYLEAQMTVEIPPSSESDDDLFVELSENDQLLISQDDTELSELDLNSGDLFSGLDDIYNEITPVEAYTSYSSNLQSSNFGAFKIYGSKNWYQAILEVNDNRFYNVALLRNNLTDALKSNVVVPTNFTLSLANTQAQYSRTNDNIDLTWTNRELGLEVFLDTSLTCSDGNFYSGSLSLGDDMGQFSIDPDFFDTHFESASGNCSASLTIRKTRIGDLDSNYSGGIIMGHQIRGVSLITSD